MILSGLKIKEEVENGNIIISPFDEKMLNPNSYNYLLGERLFLLKDDIIDPKKPSSYDEIIIPDDGIILHPNQLYLGSTSEIIGSDKYVTQLIGRSSVGRLGLFLQVTAPIGHCGCKGAWTLELKVVQPLKVYKGMKIGQVTFWVIDGDKSINYNNGSYNQNKNPRLSKFFEEGLM